MLLLFQYFIVLHYLKLADKYFLSTNYNENHETSQLS